MEGRRLSDAEAQSLEIATATSMGTVAAEGQGANLVDLKGDQAASGLDSDLALAGKWKRVEHGAEQGAGGAAEERSKLADDMPADSGDCAAARCKATGRYVRCCQTNGAVCSEGLEASLELDRICGVALETGSGRCMRTIDCKAHTQQVRCCTCA